MSFSPLDSLLYSGLFQAEEMTQLFSDETFIQLLISVEIALAKVQGEEGIIPLEAAKEIEQKAAVCPIDFKALQQATEKSGVPLIGLLTQLRDSLSEEAASYLHWGATTQDIMDSALVLQIRAALSYLENQIHTLTLTLANLAEDHRYTLIAGRTHSQQALPITFGFKVVVWLAPLLRHFTRLQELKARALVIQFGGAVGNLSALGSKGINVQQALASELNLGLALMPWHTQRDSLAEVANWLSLVSGSLAKMAQDIILLAQSEVAELRESDDPSRGGSSTMPQKSNPIQSEVIIAAARANASLLGNMHQALIQEHERATHAWQLEWLSLPQMFGLTAVCLKKANWLSENLRLDAEQMQANIDVSQGLMMAEALSFELAKQMPRAEAKILIRNAVAKVLSDGGHLTEVLGHMTELKLEPSNFKEENYLGETQRFIDLVLDEVKKTYE